MKMIARTQTNYALKGHGIEILADDVVPGAASDLWAAETANGRILTNAECLETEMFEANKNWVTKLKTDDYTVIDIGSSTGSADGPFYAMGKQILF